ncbi:FG-GAP-like repeat-containing protein [Flavisphingopyxis soli]|nr:FG-GAP-like repeat-containing protein [Sphingorhabdus soli]
MDTVTSSPAGRAVLRDRRFILIAALTLVIALYFWTQSRYPSLNLKASMGGDSPLTGISFDTLVEVLPNSSLWWDITANAINWGYTNWRGMTFGVLFAACALTLLGLIERRQFQHPFANAALGAVIGAPLGVCVNCAAPIARGLHGAGMRLETTLAALIASPTLNVIVVSMSFALLPTYMAAIKLIAMLGFILVGIPLLTRYVFVREAAATSPGAVAKLEHDQPRSWIIRTLERLRPEQELWAPGLGWIAALGWLARTYLRNLAFIAAVTVPLMLIAGILGSILVSIFPFSELLYHIELSGPLAKTLFLVGVVAAVAIFLPVPIAFDVIMAVVLLNSGWPAKFVVPMLLGLGSFSIYSFFIIARAISVRVAATMMAILAIIAALGGVAAQLIDGSIRTAAHANTIATLHDAKDFANAPADRAEINSRASMTQKLSAGAIGYSPFDRPVAHDGAGQIGLAIAPAVASMAGTAGTAGSAAFTRLSGPGIGIDVPPFLSGTEMVEPYTMYAGIAAGDIQGDGWTDVAIARDASHGGISLFANNGGRFVRQAVDLGPLEGHFINALAFVDLNGDDRPDLFASSYLHGAYVFWNHDGGFDVADFVRLPNGDAAMIGAPGFADLDGDGDVDILAANWTIGTTGNNHAPFLLSSRDRILWNDGGRFTPQLLDGLPGESLTSLITDINADGRPDILIGDDVSTSDKVYLNRGDRRFVLTKKEDGLIPWLTSTTMSLDAGDLDNDLSPDLYAAQIAFRRKKEQWKIGETYCSDVGTAPDDRSRCFIDLRNRVAAYRAANGLYARCDEIGETQYRTACALRSAIMASGYRADASACEAMPARWSDWRQMCELANGPRVKDGADQLIARGYVGGVRGRNVFLEHRADGSYEDRAKALHVDQPGWAWNAKFVDLDQDGWQDLFVATGFLVHRSYMPNTFYRNHRGLGFGNATDRAGLADTVPTSTYLLLDYDRDGDVDIIRASATTQPIVHRNDHPAGSALWIRLVDAIGNSAGIGAKIVVTNTDGTRQMRDIRQSGGFASADAPQAHFGLGKANSVRRIEVVWRDGARTRIDGPIPANAELVVRRSKG